MITENVRDEQRKFIKYNHLVANLLSFHALVTMTKALQQLLEEGHTVDMEAPSTLSPYRTEHINRFGNYMINPNRMPEPLEQHLGLSLSPVSDSAICLFFTRILTALLLAHVEQPYLWSSPERSSPNLPLIRESVRLHSCILYPTLIKLVNTNASGKASCCKHASLLGSLPARAQSRVSFFFPLVFGPINNTAFAADCHGPKGCDENGPAAVRQLPAG